MLVDERDHHFCGRSSSAAKKADAFFRISFARRSSRISCSSSLVLRSSSRHAAHPGPRSRRRRRRLAHPRAHRLDAVAELLRDALHRPRASVPSSFAQLPAPSAPPPSPARCTDASSASPVTSLFGMTPSSFPRSGASNEPRAIHAFGAAWKVLDLPRNWPSTAPRRL